MKMNTFCIWHIIKKYVILMKGEAKSELENTSKLYQELNLK